MFRTLKSSPVAYTLTSVVDMRLIVVVDVRSILSPETISVRPPDSVLMIPACVSRSILVCAPMYTLDEASEAVMASVLAATGNFGCSFAPTD